MDGPPHAESISARLRRMPFEPICRTPQDLVKPVSIDPLGIKGPTRGQAQGSRWRRVSRNLYVPASVDSDRPEQRVIEQASRLPEGGAVTGWGALRLFGAAYFDGLERDGRTAIPVPLVAARGSISQGIGSRVSYEPLDDELVMRAEVPCTDVARALFDEMRRPRDPRAAVVAMDLAAAAELISMGLVGACWVSRTCSTRRPESSEGTTEPTIGLADVTPVTWPARIGSDARVWSTSRSPEATHMTTRQWLSGCWRPEAAPGSRGHRSERGPCESRTPGRSRRASTTASPTPSGLRRRFSADARTVLHQRQVSEHEIPVVGGTPRGRLPAWPTTVRCSPRKTRST